MESFAKLKRRGTDLLGSIPHNLPSMPHLPHLPRQRGSSSSSSSHTMKGSWQHVSIPSLPRSSHSVDVVAGHAYIFGGEVESRKPVDNDMHIVVLPSGFASADYYSVKARPSPPQQQEQEQEHQASEPAPVTEEDQIAADLKDPLTDVPLSSPTPPDAREPLSPAGNAKPINHNPLGTDVPCARVGHATAVIGSRIFLFGGRSAESASEPLDERGRVWVFETKTHTWTYLDPASSSSSSQTGPGPVPPPRSYFAAVATDKPRDFPSGGGKSSSRRHTETWKQWAEGDSAEVGIPQRPIAGNVAARATDEEDAGFGTFVIHGGCLAGGARASDVWAFDVRSRTWKELPPAPGPARGGSALALAKGRLYRFGGFDGTHELGGQLDVLELALDAFDDRAGTGEVGVSARGGWQTLVPPVTAAAPATASGEGDSEGDGEGDGKGESEKEEETAKLVPTEEWPGNRSVSSLELVYGGGGREYLVLMLGERAPSAEGHAGAGRFWSDVWAFQVPPAGMTAASVTDAFLQAVGRRTGEGKWTRVVPAPYDADSSLDAQGPGPRGWLASAPLGDLEENAILVFGGLGEDNRRLGDGWVFRLG
ncbi:uncharacterized protein F4812DRAFT_435557 [Daldinia caldariorum]|uniref:uncharacterized protein n=1 Tax=Daldinia caldariorum TaxID=326644 RepID=UPI002007E59D|nr:uncharacterized protein F4812DRAFT_435557 [Daldinia caldariorum]KAI1466013.1 hypothetical protein F4812DRAFT_435557 [Daldinia caldariorum]